MFLDDLFHIVETNDDHLHAQALHATGFWGAQGAGILPFARSTKRFLLAHRSEEVEQPNDWGTWGGAIDRGETPQRGAQREFSAESGYRGPIKLIPLFVFRKNKFRYSNFLGVIDNEFEPKPDEDAAWETQGWQWCSFGHWPEPLHFGFTAILNDATSVQIMQRVLAE
jgi:8-oxo-dGTP pyrophosphatase MutT (NUDIX family)